MTEKHENRRVRMTKALIKNALLELLEQQELTNITVTAVCEAADVHRSTFYKYYTDTADLMKEIEQDLMDQIPKPHPDQTQAQRIGTRVMGMFPELRAYTSFVSPHWICRIGDFTTYEDASAYMRKIKSRGISEAMVVKSEIYVTVDQLK